MNETAVYLDPGTTTGLDDVTRARLRAALPLDALAFWVESPRLDPVGPGEVAYGYLLPPEGPPFVQPQDAVADRTYLSIYTLGGVVLRPAERKKRAFLPAPKETAT